MRSPSVKRKLNNSKDSSLLKDAADDNFNYSFSSSEDKPNDPKTIPDLENQIFVDEGQKDNKKLNDGF